MTTPSKREYILPIARSSMVYKKFSRRERNERFSKLKAGLADRPELLAWNRLAYMRRIILVVFLIAAIIFGTVASSTIVSGSGNRGLEKTIVAIFSLLFAWIAVNFFTVLFGIFILFRGKDPLNPCNVLKDNSRLSPETKIAIVIPVCNEDINGVFAGLRVMYESLQAKPEAKQFTFFILSDTTDPDHWIDEETAWQKTCQDLDACGKIIYRHRRARVRRKSGNIADFCRRWGKLFDYMIVLDSDSLMDSTAMINLAIVMDKRPDIGILQTSPKSFNAKSILARLQQFTSHAYGPIFFLGLHFWQLGDSAFWGHNAIVRLPAFMKYCALPVIRGRPPFGGMILSHDFIEAALMRRAGWGVWLAYDIEGSFEQPPATLPAELKRDRRWCRGNIQHLRFLGLRGLSLGHRWLFLNGNMFYIASFLWLLLLVLTTAQAVIKEVAPQHYFTEERALFPQWPAQHRGLAILLLLVTLAYLFVPKILAILLIVWKKKSSDLFGGRSRLTLSFFTEIIASLFIAPVRMFFHSFYVIKSLLGRKVDWSVPPRFAEGISFLNSLKLGGFLTPLALVWSFYFFHIDRALFWWTSVVLVPLMLSIPVSQWVSSVKAGRLWIEKGLLRVPSEAAPSPEIRNYESYLKEGVFPEQGKRKPRGFVSAVMEPRVHSFHIELLGSDRKLDPAIKTRRKAIAEKALRQGPQALTREEKKEILYDPELLAQLREDVRALPDRYFAVWLAQ